MSTKHRRRKFGLLVFFGGVGVLIYLVFFGSLGLQDVRPAGTVASPKAKVWFQRALRAHGSLKHWQQTKHAHIEMTATFAGLFLRKIMGPFATNKVHLTWDYTPSKKRPLQIKATYKNNPVETYTRTKGSDFVTTNKRRSANPARFDFFVRSIRHLLDFVFEMRSADVVQYAGEVKWRGQSYVRIYMTWGEPNPNWKVDQYVLWINKKTHLMERFDCTARHILPYIRFPFAKASVLFTGYRSINGLQVPSQIRVYRSLKTKTLLHGYKIHKAQFRSHSNLGKVL